VCTASQIFGDPCVACNDGEIECLFTWITADEAPYDPTATLDEAYDPANDATCQ
jgi:hypothetical protein